MQIIFRKGKSADFGFVLATWLRTFPKLGERACTLAHMRRAIGRGTLMVACSDQDLDTLVGWALAEKGDLTWIYLSNDFRKLKLGRTLRQLVIQKSKG